MAALAKIVYQFCSDEASASDDHDFAEVRSATVLDENGQIRTLRYSPPREPVAQPASQIVLDATVSALVQELHVLHADTSRVEAVPQYGHWESQQLAGTVLLARGWERQLDTVRNPLFYGGAGATASASGRR